MKRISNFVLLLILIFTTSLVTSPSHAQRISGTVPSALYPTRRVSFVPAYGYSASRVSARLSQSELSIVSQLQKMIDKMPNESSHGDVLVWRIEPTAQNSATLNLATRALLIAQSLLPVMQQNGFPKIVVVVGRTQAFIRNEVAKLGCAPIAGTSSGFYLMGATVCNRSVIVINLTGYLFLRSLTQTITKFMEERPEPKLSSQSYLYVDRNISSLAHEWVHVARNRFSFGFVPDNEPAWFREGLAEVIAGFSIAKASNGQYRFAHFHITRLRKYVDWTSSCAASLRLYRSPRTPSNGCEYFSGAAAIELLIARYGGVERVVRLLSDIAETGDFFESFARIYGLTVSQFETRANSYIRYIRLAASL